MKDKLRFESKLSEEEVQKNFEGMDFFSEVMSGLEEALDYAKGKARPTTVVRKRSLPDIDVAAERKAETCRALATSAAAMLEERVEAMSLDVDGFRQKMGAAEDERKAEYAKLDELKNQFDKFRRLLPERIGNAFDGRLPELVHAETPEEEWQIAWETVARGGGRRFAVAGVRHNGNRFAPRKSTTRSTAVDD